MFKISVEEFADLAKKRLLPERLERASMQTWRVNPLAQAIAYVDSVKTQGDKVRKLTLIAILALFNAALYFVLVKSVPAVGNPTDSLLLFGVIANALLFGASGLSLSQRFQLPSKGEAERFAVHFALFCEWVGLSSLEKVDFFGFDLEKEAYGILVRTAYRIKEFEAMPALTIEEQATHGSEISLLARQYETLSWLGLASGGFGPYYKEAIALIKRGEPASATS
ncbi:MAG: hypothetical protein Q7R54_02030 [bacterium]|nr:hypothetical protein [bacterium]